MKKNIAYRIMLSIDDVISFLVVVLAITSSLAVTHGDSTLSTDSIRSSFAYFNLVLSVLIYALCVATFRIDINLAIVIPVLYLFVSVFNALEGYDLNIIVWIRFLLVFLLKPTIRKKAIKYYRLALIIMAAFGIFGYMLFRLEYTDLYRTVEYYGIVGGEYIDFGFTYLYIKDSSIRICGLFNEPGYLGTICALVLCYDKLNYRKIGNIILFAAGILSFSLAFILIIFVFLLITSFKNPKFFVVTVVLILFYFVVMPRINVGGRIGAILNRLTFVNGRFAGDNRSNEIVDETLNRVLAESPYWGYGGGYSSTKFVSVSTYKTFIINYGIIGFTLLYGSILAVSLIKYRFRLYSFAFLVCFTASIYQRPNVFNVLYMIVLFGAMDTLTEARRKRI